MGFTRPTIALILSELEGDYATALWGGVVERAEKRDVNLLLLPGKSLNAPYPYQYQYHVIYDLISPEHIDAMIIPSSIFSNYITRDEFRKFYEKYAPIPLVSLAIPLPCASNIVMDNRVGLYEMLTHLIVAHGRRRIAFIRGPEQNPEAEERYEVYRQVLADQGIPFDPQLVCQGDYSDYSAVEAVRLLLDQRETEFDALVAANDQMAMTAMYLLQKRGIGIPEDVAVAGFDNVEGARLSIPPLSTVEQPIYEMGQRAVDMALDLIGGQPPVTLSMDSHAVIRESCGCFTYQIESELGYRKANPEIDSNLDRFIHEETDRMRDLNLPRQEIAEFIRMIEAPDQQSVAKAYPAFYHMVSQKHLGEEETFYIQSLMSRLRKRWKDRGTRWEDFGAEFFDQARIMLMDAFQRGNALRRQIQSNNVKTLRGVLSSMVANLNHIDSAVLAISEFFERFGIQTCYIGLYDHEVNFLKGQQWKSPSDLRIGVWYQDGELKQPGQKRMKTKDFLKKEMLGGDRRITMVLNPIFFLEDQLGLILCEFNPSDNYLYESLFVEMGCVLKLASLIEIKDQMESRLRDALHILEEYNARLNSLSQTDELTGLYNRRGFLGFARQSMDMIRRENSHGVLVFADLDGLKRINDGYGHEEGDSVIRQTALLLRKAFRNEDIIARLGGDEFTVFSVNTLMDTVEAIRFKLDQMVKEYNQNSGKPYKISISMGAVPFDGTNPLTIEQLLAEADHRLYQQKRVEKSVNQE